MITPPLVRFLPTSRRFGGKQAHWPYASRYFSPISRLLNAASKDWAIAFNKDKVRQIYFVAETKGSMLDSDLREKEKRKIESAEKFFATINQENQSLGDAVQYSVIDSFGSLMKLVQ